MNLTSEQIEALEFLNSNEKYLLLKGSAGVGKTTVVSEFCKRKFKVAITAPTHKAVKVLASKIDKPCQTIHSLLKLARILKGSEYIYESTGHIPEEVDIIIVDEASMLDYKLIEAICDTNIKTIFVGDSKQINPVGLSHSPIFEMGLPEFELKEIIRHQNDIIDLSRNLSWLYSKKNGQAYSWYANNELPLDLLIEANGTDLAKFITWTNATVSAVNSAVRHMIYDNPDQIEKGEFLLLNAPYKEYHNNDEVQVKDLTDSHIYHNDTDLLHPYINTWLVNNSLHIINNEDLKKHQENLQYIKDNIKNTLASWKQYYEYLERFADVQYNHCVTVHKSQGSTFDNSFINVTEILRNPNVIERERLLYTAITRSRHHNFLI